MSTKARKSKIVKESREAQKSSAVQSESKADYIVASDGPVWIEGKWRRRGQEISVPITKAAVLASEGFIRKNHVDLSATKDPKASEG